MQIQKAFFVVAVVILVAGTASADLKIVKMEHTDGFSAMGRNTPPTDDEQVSWIGADRMRMDQGDQSTIIRLDTQKLMVLHHDDKTYNTLDLPIDLTQFMPPGMADQVTAMMTFDVTVTPTDETKTVGTWKTRRYDVTMTSKMATSTMTMWVTKDAKFNQEAFYSMYEHLNSINPGLADMAKEMRKVEGLVVEQDSVTTMTIMGNVTIKRTEKATSIEDLAPPPGIYDPPADYTEKPFDFMGAMQRQ
jgi:hypothetical protein